MLSLEKLNTKITLDTKKQLITVSANLTLSELNEYLAKNDPGFGFMPNPTEPTSTIGGLISTNAKGTNFLRYGAISDNLESIKVLLLNGTIINVTKDDKDISILGLTDLDKEKLVSKNIAINYPGIIGFHKNKSILELFAGTEGILGIILEATLVLKKKVKNKYGVFFFFRENKAIEFQNAIKNLEDFKEFGVSSLEFFDNNSLDIIRSYKTKKTKLNKIPDINPLFKEALYLELEKDDLDTLEEKLMSILELFFTLGGFEDDTWAGVGEDEISKFQVLRHALPEAINIIVEENRKNEPSITKLSCDFKLDNNFDNLLKMYLDIPLSIPHALFGHILDNHLHLNFMPTNKDELDKSLNIIDSLANFVSKNNGCLAFENGIGKLKVDLIKKYLDKDLLSNAKIIKEAVDSNYLVNSGNILC